MDKYQCDHITINVSDLEKSKAFYGEILGLEELNTVKLSDQSLSYFGLGGNVRLELINYFDNQKTASLGQKNLGVYRHFALRCSSVNAIYEQCQKANVTIVMPPTVIGKLNSNCMLISDPDGLEIEFVEKL